MMAVQLVFPGFEEDETEILKKEVEEVKKSTDKVRKGIFARHNELAKQYVELHNRLEILERNICRGNL